jgi:phage tail-like protein
VATRHGSQARPAVRPLRLPRRARARPPTRPIAGFQECSGLDADIVIHRSDAAGVSAVPRKLPTDVTLKRGAIDATELHAWLAALRDGTPSAIRTVRITLTSEDHIHARQTWTLRGARIVKYVSGPFNAKATDVAIEELTLSYDSIETDE